MQTPHRVRGVRRKLLLLLVAVLLSAAVSLGLGARASADAGDPVIVEGSITWVSDDAVEVNGERGLLEPSSDVRCDGRSISRSSIHVGMPASMEMDPAGQILELRVEGATE